MPRPRRVRPGRRYELHARLSVPIEIIWEQCFPQGPVVPSLASDAVVNADARSKSWATLILAANLVIRGTHAALAANGPGSLISTMPMPGAPGDASAYRIIYTSTGLSGEPIPVSGVVIVPAGPEPPGG